MPKEWLLQEGCLTLSDRLEQVVANIGAAHSCAPPPEAPKITPKVQNYVNQNADRSKLSEPQVQSWLSNSAGKAYKS